jgi:hypothetical protein
MRVKIYVQIRPPSKIIERTTINLQTLPRFKYPAHVFSIGSSFWLRLGSRTASIYHCKLRNRSSRLNGHVFYCNLRDDPSCVCGARIEDTNHFLLDYPIYTEPRNIPSITTWGSITPSDYKLTPGYMYMAAISCRERTQ